MTGRIALSASFLLNLILLLSANIWRVATPISEKPWYFPVNVSTKE